MNILMWHGYLLTGTGSNIYVRDLVAQLVKKGHHVTLLCQEPNPEAIDFIGEAYDFLPDNQAFKEVFKRSTPYPGSCRFYKPNLGGFMPVYVWDHYDGYTVKEFHDLTQPELDRYIEQNRASVEKLLVENRIETIYTNHTVMSPYVFSLVAPKYKIPYFVVIHGSCLNYTVRKEERYMSYAVKGLDGASGVVVVSQYMADEMHKVLSDRVSGLDRKTNIIPCGVDVDAFAIPTDGKETNIRQLREVLRGTIKEKPKGRNRNQMEEFQRSLASVKDKKGLRELVLAHREKYNYKHPDQDALESLARIDWDKDEVVGYVGKFIISKGVHPILAALPGILHQRKDVKLLLIGFGTYREGLEALMGALDSGREDLLQMIAELGYALEVEEKEHPLPHLLEFWEGLRKKGAFAEYLKRASSVNLMDRVIFTGILGHEHLRYLLPCTDVSLVPSIFPEAFGMVSAEALSCGVVPLASYQTGLINILDTVNQETKGRFGDSLKIDPAPSLMVESIEQNVMTVLKQVAPDPASVKKNCRQIALDHFSWSAVCDRFLDLPALVKA